MTDLILYEDLGSGVVELSFNDPERRNAMGPEMAKAFTSVVSRLRGDPSLRVVILTGKGSAFSGGGDLNMLFEKTKIAPEENRELMLDFYHSFLALGALDVPVIAAINGHAVGAGLCVALGCDIRVASEGAKLGVNFSLLGLHPGMGATWFLPRLIGPARAAELLYTGAIISAKEAGELGLVSRVVPQDQVMTVARSIADQILKAGPNVTRQLKTTLRDSLNFTLEESLVREALCQSLNYASEEFLEGINAAREKRKPAFAK